MKLLTHIHTEQDYSSITSHHAPGNAGKIRGELKSEMENGGGEFFNGYRK